VTPRPSSRQQLGRWAENTAHRYLCAQGLTWRSSNYRCRFGEIDLIMQQNDVIVFVEVRYRKNANFGGASASIDAPKQQRLLNTANHYLQHYPELANHSCRFDALLLEGDPCFPKLDWIIDAFQAD
jgi:putative endonuclease